MLTRFYDQRKQESHGHHLTPFQRSYVIERAVRRGVAFLMCVDYTWQLGLLAASGKSLLDNGRLSDKS